MDNKLRPLPAKTILAMTLNCLGGIAAALWLVERRHLILAALCIASGFLMAIALLGTEAQKS